MVLKECLVCLLVGLALSPTEGYNSGGCSPNLISIYWCIRSKLGFLNSEESCSWNAMKEAYNELKRANCRNCDKYFHCIGNYNAVYRCQRSSTNRNTARIISDCREGGCTDADSAADQAANNYGRNGGNCASRYLCDVNCKYNPRDHSCRRSNC